MLVPVRKNRMMAGYMTVEAALVFPVALTVVLFVLYGLIYEYDRCVMEQNISMQCLLGSSLQHESKELIKRMMEQEEPQWKDLSIGWNGESPTIVVSQNSVSIEQQGTLLWKDERQWKCAVKRKNKRLRPALSLRTMAKIRRILQQQS